MLCTIAHFFMLDIQFVSHCRIIILNISDEIDFIKEHCTCHGNSAFSLLRVMIESWIMYEQHHPTGLSVGYHKRLGYKAFAAPRDVHWGVITITSEAICSLNWGST